MRGFSLLEILIAVAITTSTLISVALVIYGTPVLLANMETELQALEHVRKDMEIEAAQAKQNITTLRSSTERIFPFIDTLSLEPLEDDSITRTTATSSWKDVLGTVQSVSLTRLFIDASSTDMACDPFVSGNWSKPIVDATYSISNSGLLGTGVPDGPYTLSDLAVSGHTLIASVGTTGTSSSPSLLFFDTGNTAKTLMYRGGFDNARTSKIGFSALAVGGEYVFAGNGFGSASAQSCNDGVSCAQVQIFGFSSGEPIRISSLSLPQNSPPRAVTAGGASAPVSSLFYRKHRLYAGLQKTVGGDEFDIIDVANPANPLWVGGIAVGRTINNIFVRGSYAYLSTDDPSRELIIVDIHDEQHPTIVGSWNAPGSIGFGYGAASSARGPTIRFGRTYTANAPELTLLDASDPTHITASDSQDLGMSRIPESVRALFTQDFLTYVLTTHSLQFWNTSDSRHLVSYTSPFLLPSGTEGVALTCRGKTFYLARNDTTTSSGFIDVLSN